MGTEEQSDKNEKGNVKYLNSCNAWTVRHPDDELNMKLLSLKYLHQAMFNETRNVRGIS